VQSFPISSLASNSFKEVIDFKGKKPLYCLIDTSSDKKNTSSVTWTIPAQGWCKLNFDAGFSEDTNTGSWGAILRDEVGKILLAAWGRIDHCPSAEVAEVVAGIQSIKAILPVCDRPVHIENDCAAVIGALQAQM
jgi:hypothetical protein